MSWQPAPVADGPRIKKFLYASLLACSWRKVFIRADKIIINESKSSFLNFFPPFLCHLQSKNARLWGGGAKTKIRQDKCVTYREYV